jgi:hypothetical protein
MQEGVEEVNLCGFAGFVLGFAHDDGRISS